MSEGWRRLPSMMWASKQFLEEMYEEGGIDSVLDFLQHNRYDNGLTVDMNDEPKKYINELLAKHNLGSKFSVKCN